VPQFTRWKSLKSDGTIADTPATGWRYKYAVDVEFDYWSLTPLMQGRWEVEILGPAGNVIFAQRVNLKYTMVHRTVGSLLIMFVWWVDLQNQDIVTTVPGPVWTLGDETGHTEPAGDGDVIAGRAHDVRLVLTSLHDTVAGGRAV